MMKTIRVISLVSLLLLVGSNGLPMDPPNCDISTMEIEVPERTPCIVRNLLIQHLSYIEGQDTCGLTIYCAGGNIQICKGLVRDHSCEDISVDCKKIVEKRNGDRESIRCVQNRD